MADEYLKNAAKPEGDFGAQVLEKMNHHHKDLADWAFTYVQVPQDAQTLDIGCGGGANLQRLLTLCPRGTATGVDYAPTSVQESRKTNEAAIEAGRCQVVQGDVAALPFEDDAFDFAMACETIYFWPDLDAALAQVRRVLRPGATFLVICEMSDPNDPRFADAKDFLTVYLPDDLRKRFEAAGFADVKLHIQDEWYCLVAEN